MANSPKTDVMTVRKHAVYGLVGATMVAVVLISCWRILPPGMMKINLGQEYMIPAKDEQDTKRQLDKTRTSSYAFPSPEGFINDNILQIESVTREHVQEVNYRRFLQKREFVESENRNVFIFGAVVSNSSDASAWDVCKIYGEWYRKKVPENAISCCLRYHDGTTRKMKVRTFGKTWLSKNPNIKLQPWHVTCRPGQVGNLTLAWVSIVRGSYGCSDTTTKYTRPFFAMKKPKGYLVITTKTAHEELDPALIVNQFETFRYIGVDKVVTYVESTLWNKARKVLDYYSSIGLLEMVAYRLADEEAHPRKLLQQTHQIFADQTTVMRDAVERYYGSTYFGVLDFDEFLMPAGNMSLKQVLFKVDSIYPKASSFVFKNQHFFTDSMNASCVNNCAIFSRFFYTPNQSLNYINRKMIHHPTRIYTGTLFSHNTKAKSGYGEVSFPENLAFIRHYGPCHRKFSRKVCLDRTSWVFNTSVEELAKGKLAGKIASTMKLLDL